MTPIYCCQCNKKVVAYYDKNKKYELYSEEYVGLMIARTTPCSNCVDPLELLEKLSKGRKSSNDK